MSLYTVIIAYKLPLVNNHFPTVFATVPVLFLFTVCTLSHFLTESHTMISIACCNDCFCFYPPIFNPVAVVDCGTPPAAHVNGKQPTYSNTVFMSTVMYTCQPGYNPVGDRTITCLANGQWSAGARVCIRELTLQT